jgi:hypothetical protein
MEEEESKIQSNNSWMLTKANQVNYAEGDLVSLNPIITMTDIGSLSNIESMIEIKQSYLWKSSTMYTVMSFLRSSQILHLQLLSRKFYDVYIPSMVSMIRLPLPA